MNRILTRILQASAFIVSAALSVRLFTSLATEPLSFMLMAGLAVCLEGGKVSAIKAARIMRGFPQAVLAAFLVLLSLTASAGSALLVREGRRNAIDNLRGEYARESVSYDLRFESIQSMDAQIRSLTKKLDETPAAWAGTSKALREEIWLLRESRQREISVLDAKRLPS